MKKQALLMAVTCIFAAFLLGYFVGRNSTHGPVEVSNYQQAPVPVVTAPSTEAAPQTETAPVYDLSVEDFPDETTEPRWPLDINRATAVQLEALPGVGPTSAGRIVAYRETNGGFRSVEELLNVEGIGPRKLEGMLDYVSVGG